MSSRWIEPAAIRRMAERQSVSAEARFALVAPAREGIRSAAEALIGMQHADGYWRGDLTADTTLESDYVLLQLWLYPPENGVWNPPTRRLVDKAARSILDRQLPDGGFNIYPGGPADVSASAKAYFACKVAGLNPNSPELQRARECILRLGGIQAANSYVRINLSLFGLYPREHAPTIPPEIMLVPGKVLYEMSSWTRAIIVPLSIVQAKTISPRPVPADFHLNELRLPDRSLAYPNEDGIFSWRNFFLRLDMAFKIWERRGYQGLRAEAVRAAEHWMLDRTHYSEGLGAIYPSMMYLIMAMDLLGYRRDHPDFIKAVNEFDALMVETENRFFFQPCVSPIWDTAIAAYALGEAGVTGGPSMERAADWLISKEVRRKGDWSVKRPDLEPSGWYFEFANEFYPDIDDCAQVLLALHHAKGSNPTAQEACMGRALNWLINMQSSDGGWAAFDVDNHWQILNKVPFADHNAMLDPTCPDITGRVLDALITYNVDREQECVRRGVRWLLDHQEKDGSWYGRWGVDYIYGSFLAMRGLRAAARSESLEALARGANWLRSIQNQDGGWGESCASYRFNHYVQAHSTASQTSWALLGLMAAGDANTPAVNRGVKFLLERQKPDGTWDEDLATGTGFPNVFYLTYHLYRNYFPVLALACYLKKNAVRS